jgi:uncharacterized membrane protein
MAERIASGLTSAVQQGAGGVAGRTLKHTGEQVHDVAKGAGAEVRDVATGAGAEVRDVATDAGAEVRDVATDAGAEVRDVATDAGTAVGRAVGGRGPQRTLREELREIVREAALEILVPVARRATTQAAMYAVKRGPQMARDTIVPKLGAAIEEAGGPGALAKGALSSVSGARAGFLGRAAGSAEPRPRPWRERPLPVEESVDVVAPLETAYGRFGEFEEYATVMSHGETVDARPNERIAWRRTDGVDASAVITFHRLSDRLTRVMITYDARPHGVLERTTALFHTSPRALGTDLMRFKAFVEMNEEPQNDD